MINLSNPKLIKTEILNLNIKKYYFNYIYE